MPKMRWRPGLRPDPAGGAHDAPPDPLLLLLLLLLLHDLYSANFEDRVRGAGVARWRT